MQSVSLFNFLPLFLIQQLLNKLEWANPQRCFVVLSLYGIGKDYTFVCGHVGWTLAKIGLKLP